MDMKTNSWMNAGSWVLVCALWISGSLSAANVIRWRDASGFCSESVPPCQFVLERQGDLRSELSVQIETRDGSATGGSDFLIQNQTVVFLAGEATATVSASVINDASRESNERFQLAILSPPPGWSIQGSSVFFITIEDNDPGFSFGFGWDIVPFEQSVGESASVVRIPVQRGADSVVETWVEYEVIPDTALAGQDYLGTHGRLLFAPQETMQWIEIPIVSDTTPEPQQEFFSVRLTRSSPGTSLGSVRLARVTIVDDDLGPSLELTQISPRATESSDGFQIQVYRGQIPAVGTVEVGYRTVSESAIAGQDFVPMEGVLAFQPGEFVKTIHLSLVNDTFREGDETFLFELLPIAGSPAPSSSRSLSLVIEDDDLGFRVDPFSLIGFQREEGEPLILKVLRADDRPQSMSVGFRIVAGTATAGEDFVPSEGRLHFGPSEKTQPLIIRLLDDSQREETETFRVELFDPEGGELADAPTFTVRISSNDDSPSFYVSPWAKENEAMGHIMVSVLEPSDHDVHYRVVVRPVDGPGAAIPGNDLTSADFQPIDEVVTIPLGGRQAIAHFPVSTQNRGRSAQQRNLVVQVSPLSDSGEQAVYSTEFRIADEPTEFELIPPFDLPRFSAIPEGAGTFQYRLRRGGDISASASVEYQIRGFNGTGSARPGIDFVPAQGTLRFTAGETEQLIPVTVIDGKDVNPQTESLFELSLNLIEGEGTLGAIGSSDHPRRGSVILRVRDNDATPESSVQPSFDLDGPFGNQLVEMEGNAEFVLRRTVSLDSPLVCRVEVQPLDPVTQPWYDPGIRSATPKLDFEVSSVEIRFAPGQSKAPFSIGLHADLEVEETEVFFVHISWTSSSGVSNHLSLIMNLLDATALPMRIHPLTRDEQKGIDLGIDEKVFPDGSRLFVEPLRDRGQPGAVFRVDSSGGGRSGFTPVLHRRGSGTSVGNAPHHDVTLGVQGDRFWTMHPVFEITPQFRLQRFLPLGQPDPEIAPMELTTSATFTYSAVWHSDLWYPLRLIPDGTNAMALLGATGWINGRLTPYGARIILDPQELDVAFQSGTVSEADGSRFLVIRRFGDIRLPASYRWKIMDGTAKSGRDYVPGTGLLEFASGESLGRIPLTLIDNETVDFDRTLVLRFERTDSGRVAAEVEVVVANDDPGILDILPVPGDSARVRFIVTGPLAERSFQRDVNVLASSDLVRWSPVLTESYPPLGFYPDDPGWRVLVDHHQQYFKAISVRR